MVSDQLGSNRLWSDTIALAYVYDQSQVRLSAVRSKWLDQDNFKLTP